MKKIIFLLVTVLTLATSYAQNEKSTVYSVFQSEFYSYNDQSEKWVLETQNKDVSIDMVFYKDAINIQAKTPTLFKVKVESKEPINGDGFFGYRFDALECVEGRRCTVDYIYFKDNKNGFLLSIIFKDDVLGKVNLRYYSTLNN